MVMLRSPGSRAQVVIANPAGISCNGCGFINANRATLTTGTPILNSGDLMGYRVTGGSINFLGVGLDASHTDYTDIIARAVHVNAGLWANNLNVITGSNQVDVNAHGDASRVAAIAGSGITPAFAVDVAALGGMYAGKIHLLGTEAGLGVRNAGSIGASAGEVRIDVNGMLINSGSINSSGLGNDLKLSTQGFNNAGTISSQANLHINNQGDVQNSGLITTDRELKLDASGALTNNQGTLSGQRLLLSAAGLINTQGIIQQTGHQALSLTVKELRNINHGTDNGLIGNMPLDTGGSGSGGGTGGGLATIPPPTTAVNGGTVTIVATAPVVLADGMISISGNVTNDGGKITANGNMDVLASDVLQNSATFNLHKISFTGHTFNNAGGTLNVAQAQINTSLLNNSQGNFTVTEALQLTAHTVLNHQGTLQQSGDTDLSIRLLGDLDNTQGHIKTNAATLTLEANLLSNTDGVISHAGGGALAINANTLSGVRGSLKTSGDLNLIAQTVSVDAGTTTAAKQININAGTLSNNHGEIMQTGTAAASIKATIKLDNSSGSIASNGDTTVTVGNLINQGGAIQATGTANLAVNATGAIDNRILNGIAGKLQAGGAVALMAASLDNTQGQVTAGSTLNVITTSSSNGIDNQQGLLAANQALSVSTLNLDNSNGAIASVGADVDITATSGSINSTFGQISAAQHLQIISDGMDNASGSLTADSANIDTQLQALDNTRGTVIASHSLDLQTGTLSNDAGILQSGGDMTVNTHGQTLSNSHSGTDKGILSQTNITLATGALNNQTGYIGANGTITANSAAISNNTGTITSQASVTLNGSRLDNQTGRVEALGNVVVNATTDIDNRSGLLRSGQTLMLAAASVDNRNTQATDATATPTQGIAGQSAILTADQIDNNAGAIRTDDALAIVGSGVLNNSLGLISSGKTINIADRLANINSNVTGKTLAIFNTGGTIIAGASPIIADTDLSIDVGSLSGDGKVLSKGDLTTKLSSNYTHTGEWQATGNASFVTNGILTNQARLLAGNTLSLTAATIDNQASGEIIATTLNLAATDTHTLTNRGLINGSDTFINTATLNNIGTGRIYGDHVAIAATILNNQEETVNGVTTAAVIAARDRLDIAATTISNREHALLFSAGDMAIGGSLDGNHQASVASGQPQATTLNNSSASIEALGNLNLNVASINNTNAHFSTQLDYIGSADMSLYQPDGYGQYRPDQVYITWDKAPASVFYPPATAGFNWMANSMCFFCDRTNNYLYLNVPNVTTSRYFNVFDFTRSVSESHLLSSDPARILAGGNLQFTAHTLYNDNSQVIAGGTLAGNVTTLSNVETFGQRITTDNGTRARVFVDNGHDDSDVDNFGYNPAPVIESINLGSLLYVGNTGFVSSGTHTAALNPGSVSQTAGSAGNANADSISSGNAGATTQVDGVAAANPSGPATLVRTASANSSLLNNSLYHSNPNTTANFYIETDPAFAGYRNWLSSDYLLTALSINPALTQKRLGDGFVEQRLLREQIHQLTGRRFLTGYADDEAQYQALMSNGATFAQQYALIPGIALTAAQMAQLTSDIVWLVEQSVTLSDGSRVQALLPQVYVRLRDGDLDGAGALLAGDNVNLNISADLINSGSIAGRNVLKIDADNINNLAGRMAANNTQLSARTDLNNIGGSLQGGDSLSLSAGHDINVVSTTHSSNSAGLSTHSTSSGQAYSIVACRPEG